MMKMAVFEDDAVCSLVKIDRRFREVITASIIREMREATQMYEMSVNFLPD
jgi:hypothetical protein